MVSRKEVAWTVNGGRRITEVRMTEHKDPVIARWIWAFRMHGYVVSDVTINGVAYDENGDPVPVAA